MRKDSRTMKALVGSGLAALATLLSVGTVYVSSAAYTDEAYAKSETLVADLDFHVPIDAGMSKIRSVDTAGGISKDGNVYLWGYITFLAGLQNNPYNDSKTGWGPTKVAGLPEGKMASLSGQIYDMNALDTDGYVWGWGVYGRRSGLRLYDTQVLVPERVRVGGLANTSAPLLDEIMTISTSEMAGAGIRSDGSIYRWGYYAYGGAITSAGGQYEGAQKVPGLPDPLANNGERFPVYLNGGYTSFWTILANGEVWHWGSYSSNPKADGESAQKAVQSKALSPWFKCNVKAGSPYIVSVVGGINMGQALLSNGQVLTWSYSGDTNRIGKRSGTANAPAINTSLSDIVEIRAGFTGMIALNSKGEVWGFGASDDYGRFAQQPQRYDTNSDSITAGQGYYIWHKTDGTVWGQGYNPRYAIGVPQGQINSKRQVSWDLSMLVK